MEKISRSICLTVPERKIKFSKIQEIHNSLNLKLIKFDGIVGAKLSPSVKLTYPNLISSTLVFVPRRKARLAIALSHILMWKSLSKYHDTYSLILEDDIKVNSIILDKINAALSQIDFDWDILYFGYSGKLKGTQIGSFLFAQSGNYIDTNHGMFAYIINPKSVDKILKTVTPIKTMQHIDWLLREKYGNQIIAVYYTPSIIQHDNSIPSLRKKLDII